MQAPERLSGIPELLLFADRLFKSFEPAWNAAADRCVRGAGRQCIEVRGNLEGMVESARRGIADHAGAVAEGLRLLIALGGSLDLPLTPIWGASDIDQVSSKHAPRHLPSFETMLKDTRYRAHLHMENGRFWQFFDRESGRGIELLQHAGSAPKWDGGSPLRNFLTWHLNGETASLVHAGTLARDGRGLMFLGPGGSGKSGTVLAGIVAGLESVGDDYVLVRVERNVVAEQLFSTLKCDPAGLSRLGLAGIAASSRPLNWQGKHEFTFADLGGAPPSEGIEITALCLPVVSHAAESRFEPISSKQAFLALAPTGMAQTLGIGNLGDHFSFCAALTRRLPAYRLHLGTRPKEIVGAITRFLADRHPSC